MTIRTDMTSPQPPRPVPPLPGRPGPATEPEPNEDVRIPGREVPVEPDVRPEPPLTPDPLPSGA